MANNDVLNAVSISLQTRITPFILGSPGIGKSSMIEALSDTLGWDHEIVLPQLREVSDFAGLPFVYEGEVRLAPPNWAVRADKGAKGKGGYVVVLDEVTCATPQVQSAM